MSRFRLYGSGGRPVHDSEGEPADRRLDRIKREFNAGVAAVYDPDAGLVRTQVKIHRRSPEQFVATYQSDADEDLLAALVEHVGALADRREWTIQHGIGGTQALYDAVADGSAFDPDAYAAIEDDLADRSIGPDDLRDAVSDLGAVDLLVPDYEVAAAVLGYVRETFEGYTVAVTESTDVETISGADVVIRPDGAVDRVSPGPEFSGWIERLRAAAAMRSLERAVDSAAERFESTSGAVDSAPADDAVSVPVGAGVAAAVNRTGRAADLGIRAVPPSAPSISRRELRHTAVYGIPSGVVVGVVVGLAWLLLSGLPQWGLAAGGVVVALAWAGGLAALRLRDGGDADPDVPALGSEPGEIADALERITAAGDADAAREALSSAIEPYGVRIEPVDDRERRRRRAIGVGVAASVVVCALAFAVAAFLPGLVG